MKFSKTGQFYGETNEIISLDGITLTDTEYSQERVPWHFHENNYFTFILQGGMTEANKKETYECCAGDLLFHNWQDAHYNIASGRFTRGFHVELGSKWFESFDLVSNVTEGSIDITSPRVKTLMYKVLQEMKLTGAGSQLGIDALLVEIFGLLGKMKGAGDRKKPQWVGRIKEMLHESQEDHSLGGLATSLNVHPVHLSREFSRYFDTTLGEYIRTIKVQRALALLPNRELSLTDISFECGFADQSHFIRSFRSTYHVTPLFYRKLLLKRGPR
ncbi:MAG TPA: AraC family transcriptional regulator [Puia sp.]|jgi:AraC family transcriptional regulator|nr:AraC family transcriptional regulator [Puia sp.]